MVREGEITIAKNHGSAGAGVQPGELQCKRLQVHFSRYQFLNCPLFVYMRVCVSGCGSVGRKDVGDGM